MSVSSPIVQTEPLTPFIDTLFGNNKLNNATFACLGSLFTPTIVAMSTIVNESSFNTFGVITVLVAHVSHIALYLFL